MSIYQLQNRYIRGPHPFIYPYWYIYLPASRPVNFQDITPTSLSKYQLSYRFSWSIAIVPLPRILYRASCSAYQYAHSICKRLQSFFVGGYFLYLTSHEERERHNCHSREECVGINQIGNPGIKNMPIPTTAIAPWLCWIIQFYCVYRCVRTELYFTLYIPNKHVYQSRYSSPSTNRVSEWVWGLNRFACCGFTAGNTESFTGGHTHSGFRRDEQTLKASKTHTEFTVAWRILIGMIYNSKQIITFPFRFLHIAIFTT